MSGTEKLLYLAAKKNVSPAICTMHPFNRKVQQAPAHHPPPTIFIIHKLHVGHSGIALNEPKARAPNQAYPNLGSLPRCGMPPVPFQTQSPFVRRQSLPAARPSARRPLALSSSCI